ncbi:PH domain-containing protein [Candidatus Saccharibacteria bacterium]|nr:PH domain-containing protein [Candidatus Saccharibacteria bacterium]
MSELQFDGQRDDEKVMFIFRRHAATARRGLFFLAAMIVLGVIPMVLWKDDSRMFWIFLGCVIVGVFGAFYAYLLWYFSIFIVTNERIRQITQKGLFKKTTTDLWLDKIQSISYSVPTVLAGIFNYGTILIQTAAGDLVISGVPKPSKIHNKLQNIAKDTIND